ncbi:MAG: glycosyltransferase family 87 protein, partial [Planctomycetia bacterium]
MKVFGRDWPLPIVLAWQAAALFVIAAQGPGFVESLAWTIRPDRCPDYLQDWAAAQNHLHDWPIYTRQDLSFGKYTSLRLTPVTVSPLVYNLHPPLTVALSLPFADPSDLGDAGFRRSFFRWNIFSLLCVAAAVGLLVYVFGRPPAALLLPAAAICLLYYPLRQQVIYGQWNGLLLLLLTATWLADRSGKSILAGVALALAISIKLFPGAVLVYLVARRRWTTIAAVVLTLLVVHLILAGAFGWSMYHDYLFISMPSHGSDRAFKYNYSAWGFWERLFVGHE